MQFKEYTGLEYLKIDIANNFSDKLEKSNFEDRITWFDENKDKLFSLTEQADNPALFYAGVLAYKDYKNNKPSGYLISLDACCSGIQLLSALTNCRKSAKLCGLINDNRVDAYTILYNLITNGEGKFERKDVKKVIMTHFYNSQKEPKNLFGEGEMLQKFFQVMEEEVTGPDMLNKAIGTLWNSKALKHSFVLPDNFHVELPIIDQQEEEFTFLGEPMTVVTKVNKPTDNYRSLSPNIIHSIDGFIVRELQRRCNYDPKQISFVFSCLGSEEKTLKRDKDKMLVRFNELYKETGIMSLRVIDYIDTFNAGLFEYKTELKELIQSLPYEPFKVLSIHD